MGIAFGSISTGLPKDIVKQIMSAEQIPVQNMEKQNEATRRELMSHKTEIMSKEGKWYFWVVGIFGCLSLLLGLRYFFIHKKLSKID